VAALCANTSRCRWATAPFHGAQAHNDAELALQLLAHDVTVAAVLAKALGQPLGVLA